ncbi:GTPase activator [Micromonospora sp. NPDC048930]|uniref:GTPase activator n=1 Tax=Micromonospora sp. NPDC048930 TaxID=3364261 RepID=UPI00371EE792
MGERRDEAVTRQRDDRDPRATREAEEAHGGSMAPGLVDDTGHPVAGPPEPETEPAPRTELPGPPTEPSAMGTPGEDGTGS